MYKFSFSVRAYNISLKRGYDLTTATGCIAAANDLLINHGTNKKVMTELYRAGGLGVYQIAAKIGKDLESVKIVCERLDRTLHESI